MAGPVISKNFMLLANAVLVIAAGLAPRVHAQAATNLPPDVRGVISRRSSCLEWSKKASDPERKTEFEDIKSVMQSLKCEGVSNDETTLRREYAGNPDILRALDATWVKIVKRLPVRIPVLPDPNR